MDRPKVLIVDAQLAGHHILWLCLVARSMLELGCDAVLLAHGDLDEVKSSINQLDGELLSVVTLAGFPLGRKTSVETYLSAVAAAFLQYRCDRVILNNFDTIASGLFRKVLLGYRPPLCLFGKINAIYHRPRPLDATQNTLGNVWKRQGMRVLLHQGFFTGILLLDPFLIESSVETYGAYSRFVFIPDPWRDSDEDPVCPPELAGAHTGGIRLLQYGVGDGRKGTELLVNALKQADKKVPLTLIIAGVQKNAGLTGNLAGLKKPHSFVLIDRFISGAEEKFLLQYADYLTIPYLSHYGSSNILSKAAQYAKPVIASDYHLIGRLVGDYGLGVLFKDNNVRALASALESLSATSSCSEQLNNYRGQCSYQAFKHALAGIMRLS
jgi:glycosyltransferase involved in cell wall biosynthesis